MVHGLSCFAACGIFPDWGLNPCPLHWQVDSKPLPQQGSPMTPFYRSLSKALRLFKFRQVAKTRFSFYSPFLFQDSKVHRAGKNQYINWFFVQPQAGHVVREEAR